MEDEECGNVLGGRKRTESSGGNSDSDLSEGWNIVDHLDTNSPEVPSSDGESVEVIEGEDDIPQHGDADFDTEMVESATEVVQSDCPSTAVMTVDNPPSLALSPSRDEMLDLSFCMFLLTATFTVLVSHLAFMAAENVFSWNTTMSYDFPSFLRDLPTTPKPLPQVNFADKIPWASDEEVNVDVVDGMFTEEPGETVIIESSLPTDDKILSKGNQNAEKLNLKINNNELGKYLKVLSNMTNSVETQRKFAQAMLILDSLQIGINDLEELVTDNSELNQLLNKQTNKLNDVITEVKLGMSRSLERLATNVFNKVQTIERRFEKQWCRLEQNGHKEELKGLFYDCEDYKNEYKIKDVTSEKRLKENNGKADFKKEKHYKKGMSMEGYKVDKDSAGKVYSKENNANGDNNDYYKLVKKEKTNKNKSKHKLHDSTNYNDIKTSKFNYNNKDSNNKERFKHLPENNMNEKRHSKKEKHIKESESRQFQNHKGTPEIKKSIEEVVSNIFKELCNKNKEVHKKSTNTKDYKKLKDEVDKTLKLSQQLFEKMYLKFCVHNSEGIKKEYSKQNNKENTLKNNESFRNKNQVIEPLSSENVFNFKISSPSEINSQDIETTSDDFNEKVIEPVNKSEWTLSYEIPSPVNKTNANGDWFIKSGESRSRVRWSHQRSDWWFDRSFQRRHYQYNYPHPPNWFVGRRKNWFFRRAWARQQCKENPHNNWCHLDDDTVTIPNSNFS